VLNLALGICCAVRDRNSKALEAWSRSRSPGLVDCSLGRTQSLEHIIECFNALLTTVVNLAVPDWFSWQLRIGLAEPLQGVVGVVHARSSRVVKIVESEM
jgi:hypothetical protein